MKKNILLVQSLLTLPLLTSSFIFSSEKSIEKPEKTYAEAAQGGTQLPLPPSLKRSASLKREKRKERKRQQKEQQALTVEIASPVLAIQEEIVEIPLSLDAQTAKQSIVDAKNRLEQLEGWSEILSIIRSLPEEKGLHHVEPIIKTYESYTSQEQSMGSLEKSTLGFQPESRGFDIFSKIANTFTSYKNTVIKYLTSNTFEIDNQDHLDWLDQAVIECVDTDDMKSLLTIAKECQDKYPSVKYSDTDSLFQFLRTTYINQVEISHKALELHNQEYATEFNKKSAALKEQIVCLSNTHRALTAELVQKYEAEATKEKQKLQELQQLIINTAVLLDRPNNLKKVTLFANNQLQIPTNSVAQIRNAADQKMTSLITNSNLPLIQASTSK